MSKLSQGQLIAGGAGVVLIISLFLDWGFGQSAFDAFSGMDIIMLVIGAAAVAYAALPAAGSAQSLPTQSGEILLLLGVLVFGFALSNVLEDSSAGIGAWLGFLASAGIAFGTWEAASGTPAVRTTTRAAAPPPPPPSRPASTSAEPPASSSTEPPASTPAEPPASSPPPGA